MFEPVSAEVLQDYKGRTSTEVFRLEFRRFYNVEADLLEFEKWKRGEPTAADDPDNPYWQETRSLRDRGVSCRRIRVVDFPVSEYLRYEIDFYRGSERHGEEVLFSERAPVIDCMQSTVVTQDYWLFDGEVALLWKYDTDGRRDGQEVSEDESAIPYRDLRDCLMGKAIPMERFMERYPQSFTDVPGPS